MSEQPSEPAGHLPERIGPYRVVKLLGEGGMGVVYAAEQELPSRRVAVKVVRGGHRVDADRLRMFRREVDTLARAWTLHHALTGAAASRELVLPRPQQARRPCCLCSGSRTCPRLLLRRWKHGLRADTAFSSG